MAKVRKRRISMKSKRAGKSYSLWPATGEPSRWDFWKEGVSSSTLGLFLTCREQFRLEMVEGWRSYHTPLAFAFGTCGHWIIEQAYAEVDPPNAAGVRKLVKQYEVLWRKEIPNPPKYVEEMMQKVFGLAEALMPTYFERWMGDFYGKDWYPVEHNTAAPEEWIGLEERFRIPFTFDDGRQTWINGTRDGLFSDHRNDVFTIDHKFRSVINEDQITDTLPFDLQQMLYLWANSQVYPDRKIAGTVMNIVRRPGHRQLKGEPDRKFYQRVADDVADPKRWDHFFMRFEMRITSQEITRWFHDQLTPIMNDLRAWWEGTGPHYLNSNNLVTKYGTCGMYEPIVHNNFTGCYQRDAGTLMNYQSQIG